MLSRKEAILNRAQFLLTGPRWNEPVHIEAAIIGAVDDIRVATCAASLRRAGIPTATYLSGNRKRQIAKAREQLVEYLILLDPDNITVRDPFSGEEQTVEIGQVAEAVMECLIYDWRITDWEMEERQVAHIPAADRRIVEYFEPISNAHRGA